MVGGPELMAKKDFLRCLGTKGDFIKAWGQDLRAERVALGL